MFFCCIPFIALLLFSSSCYLAFPSFLWVTLIFFRIPVDISVMLLSIYLNFFTVCSVLHIRNLITDCYQYFSTLTYRNLDFIRVLLHSLFFFFFLPPRPHPPITFPVLNIVVVNSFSLYTEHDIGYCNFCLNCLKIFFLNKVCEKWSLCISNFTISLFFLCSWSPKSSINISLLFGKFPISVLSKVCLLLMNVLFFFI